ncbi:MAG TPA: protein-disulfide reductase DsbD N-terminal domain-containing protein [Blastocatellia bacterium]|nr:protein-disulfide reductase DsbD N-terminal domain-containing protein [Blastocatellia bacterium]
MLVSAFSRASEQENPIKWSLAIEPAKQSFQAGDQFTAQLTAQIEEGWHLYALEEVPNGPRPTRITLGAEQPFELSGEIESPAPIIKFDPNFGIETQFFAESVTFTLPVKITAAAKSGNTNLVVQTRYQVCNEQLCLPPKTVKVETAVEIK